VIERIADVPLVQLDPLRLLNLEHDRDAPDLDFAGFGWGRAREIDLASPRGRTRVHDVLVLALHSADVQPDGDDVLLELELEEQVVRAPLQRLLALRLPALLGVERDVVLALCNPRSVRIAAPPRLGARTLHYADGDVLSWLDRDADGDHIRLDADDWHIAREGQG
jgi:hypothetical protein